MAGFQCATCGQFHEQLPMVLGSQAPVAWFGIPESEREERAQLSSDQCIVDDEHFFILGQLEIPVHDSLLPFTWLVWVSLSEASFERASELWDADGREAEPPYFGWLQSALPYHLSTLALKAAIHTQPVGKRPVIELEQTDHPLSLEQRHGISFERVQQIVEAAMHGHRA